MNIFVERAILVMALVLVASCSGNKPSGAGTSDAGSADAGQLSSSDGGIDAGLIDAGTSDAGSPDAGLENEDAGIDAGPGSADAGLENEDAGIDAGPGSADAGQEDEDAGTDAGSNLCAGVTCLPLDQCHSAGSCDPSTGACTNPAATDGTNCVNGNLCYLTSSCQQGVCTGVIPVLCVAGQCQVAGACDPSTGTCSHSNASCDDGNACTSNDQCTDGTCAGTSYTCEPGACQEGGTCDGTGDCSYQTSADGTGCGAGLICSTGSCVADCFIDGTVIPGSTPNPVNGCQVCDPASSITDWSNAFDGTSCDDGNACTASDVCTAGVCGGTSYSCSPASCQMASTCDGNGGCNVAYAPGGVSCVDDGNACTADVCDSSGDCTHPTLTDGTSCGSGLECESGSCVATPPFVVTTAPQDGSQVTAGATISVTFSEAMDPTTLVVQTSPGACSGSVQVMHNHDGDSDCIAFASASPVMSAGDTVATFTAAPGLLVNRAYSLLVSTSAKSAGGAAMGTDYSMTTGFVTTSPPSPIVQNESGSAEEVDYCDMQFPTSFTGSAGSSETFYGQIYEVLGGTQITGTGSQSASITAQFGYAPANADGSALSNPEYESAWVWADAQYNYQHYIDTHDGNDEYMYTLTLPASGLYSYTYRFSVDGGASWTYADVGGAGSNSDLNPFDFNQLATLEVQ
jgi:hypothetical protein